MSVFVAFYVRFAHISCQESQRLNWAAVSIFLNKDVCCIGNGELRNSNKQIEVLLKRPRPLIKSQYKCVIDLSI